MFVKYSGTLQLQEVKIGCIEAQCTSMNATSILRYHEHIPAMLPWARHTFARGVVCSQPGSPSVHITKNLIFHPWPSSNSTFGQYNSLLAFPGCVPLLLLPEDTRRVATLVACWARRRDCKQLLEGRTGRNPRLQLSVQISV